MDLKIRKDFEYYYPTNVLVTGWDIIFLWVARMAMAGYEWKNERPFDHVYFTGMVRDKKRRKMSKSLGNSPDALKLIEDFGADGVRFGMLSCSPAGGDLLFDEKAVRTGSELSAIKCGMPYGLLKDGNVSDSESDSISLSRPLVRDVLPANNTAVLWFKNKLNKILAEVEENFKQYRLSEALITLYSFVWNDFFSIYLEIIKPQ